jgi:hypothetical protein
MSLGLASNSALQRTWRIISLPALLQQPARTVAGGGAVSSAAAAPVEVDGVQDGPDLVLPSGVRIRRKRVGMFSVTQAELQQAVRGVQLLPLQHQLVIARAGIPIELLPIAHLEQVSGTSEPVLGATAVVQDSSGAWIPTRVRVAVRSPLAAVNRMNSIGEVTQHEIGHALAVLGNQDRSEEAAIRYAARY